MDTIPAASGRARKLARQKNLTLADFIELTGLAPDYSGKLGLFDVDPSGIRFTLRESTIRLRPAAEQVAARRLVEDSLSFPCTPAELAAFSEWWPGELPLPAAFVREVEVQQAELASRQWADGLIEGLKALGLANKSIDYNDVRRLTTFGQEHLWSDDLTPGAYRLQNDESGCVVGIEAGERFGPENPWLEDSEMDVFGRHREAARLTFPATVEQLIRWVANQGGDVDFARPYDSESRALAEQVTADIEELAALLGVVEGSSGDRFSVGAGSGAPVTTSEAGRRGADSRNVRNREAKKQAIAAYTAGDYSTKDAAAEDLSGRLGFSFRTIRDWLKGVE